MKADFPQLISGVSTCRAESGRAIALVMLMPPDALIPSADVRRDANVEMDRLLAGECASVDIAIEGSGVVPDMVRTLVRGLARTLKQRERVFFHTTLDAAVSHAAPSRNGALAHEVLMLGRLLERTH